VYQEEICRLIELLAVIIGGLCQLEIAQELVSRFGSVQAIANATHDEIMRYGGYRSPYVARL